MTYTPHPHHRDGRPAKSQWTISIAEELASFDHAGREDWLMPPEEPTVGWGLHCVEGSPCVLGVAVDRSRDFIIAKFVTSNGSDWHGYPADHQSNPQDIPLEAVLASWLQGSLFSAAKVRKIVRGQPCRI
jgi:hypothetical protein